MAGAIGLNWGYGRQPAAGATIFYNTYAEAGPIIGVPKTAVGAFLALNGPTPQVFAWAAAEEIQGGTPDIYDSQGRFVSAEALTKWAGILGYGVVNMGAGYDWSPDNGETAFVQAVVGYEQNPIYQLLTPFRTADFSAIRLVSPLTLQGALPALPGPAIALTQLLVPLPGRPSTAVATLPAPTQAPVTYPEPTPTAYPAPVTYPEPTTAPVSYPAPTTAVTVDTYRSQIDAATTITQLDSLRVQWEDGFPANGLTIPDLQALYEAYLARWKLLPAAPTPSPTRFRVSLVRLTPSGWSSVAADVQRLRVGEAWEGIPILIEPLVPNLLITIDAATMFRGLKAWSFGLHWSSQVPQSVYPQGGTVNFQHPPVAMPVMTQIVVPGTDEDTSYWVFNTFGLYLIPVNVHDETGQTALLTKWYLVSP